MTPSAAAGEGAVRVRYFAWLREELGQDEERITLPLPCDVASLIDILRHRGPRWQAAFAPGRRVRAACNHRFVDPACVLADGDEIAFFPPVTGG